VQRRGTDIQRFGDLLGAGLPGPLEVAGAVGGLQCLLLAVSHPDVVGECRLRGGVDVAFRQ